MVTPDTSGDNWVVEIARRPAVYLDHCGLSDLAVPGELNERFLNAFRARGELIFSRLNLIELASRHDRGRREVERFLEAVGPAFFPVKFEFDEVFEAHKGRLPDIPAFTCRLLLDAILAAGRGPTLSGVVDHWVADDHRAFIEETKQAGSQAIMWLKAQGTMDGADNVPCGQAPTVHVAARLFKARMSDLAAFPWEPNDVHDMMHIIVPIVLADAIVLDKKWHRRVEGIALGSGFGRSFPIDKLADFVAWFETAADAAAGKAPRA